ncbi:hypothetical protein [Shimazuella kribbensis]|nr:hypothetical protein [Shimazuella kribbensis]
MSEFAMMLKMADYSSIAATEAIDLFKQSRETPLADSLEYNMPFEG